MEQDRNFTPRWFEPENWDGQDSSRPEPAWEPDEIDRLLHPELFEGPDALPVPAHPAPAPPEESSSEAGSRRTPCRRDGFTPERQEQFLELIRGGASGREAARRIRISPTTAYNLYNSPKGAAFRAAWDEAARVTDIVLDDTAFDRAVNGQEEVVYHQGRRVGVRWKYDNNLLMKLLRARNPLKYAPLSEIEGWLRHRGIAPPADVDSALQRLREAEAAHPLPAAVPPSKILPGTGRGTVRSMVEGAGPETQADPDPVLAEPAEAPSISEPGEGVEEPPIQSTSPTSPETGEPEAPSAASTSSTSPETGQAPATSAACAPLPEPEPSNPSLTPYRPPPRPRITLL